MNSKRIKNFGAGVIVLLITVCFIPAIASSSTPGDGRQDRRIEVKGHHQPALGIWRNPQMVQKLELTENQVKQIKDADFTFREKRLELKAQLDSFRLQMDKAFSDETVDNAAVLSTSKKISDMQGKMFVQEIESRLALGKILTADQIKKMNLYDMQPKRKGPGPGGKHKLQDGSMERPCDEKPFKG